MSYKNFQNSLCSLVYHSLAAFVEKVEFVSLKMGNSSTSKRSESDNGEKIEEIATIFC